MRLQLQCDVMANETAKTYFPGTLGSYWVYEDQDGNELTRTVDEGEEIAGETFNIFIYEPDIEDWANYAYHFLPSLYSVDDESITCLIGDEIEKATKARLTKEMEAFTKMAKKSIENIRPPEAPNLSFDINYDVEVEGTGPFRSVFNCCNRQRKVGCNADKGESLDAV